MHWQDDGIVLSSRVHGENDIILGLLTADHGRHNGLVRGGAGRRLRGVLQPGNEVNAQWRGRTADVLGSYTIELKTARAARLMDLPLKLATLSSACAMVEAVLPEQEPHPSLYQGFQALLDHLENGEARNFDWAQIYVHWELALMAETGFGLDLTACAATGRTDQLTHVSPRSGRAVSAAAAAPYGDRLLRLPFFLANPPTDLFLESKDLFKAVCDGLALTGFFLERHVLPSHGRNRALPPARQRLEESFARLATTPSVENQP